MAILALLYQRPWPFRSGLRADSIIGVLFAGMFALGVALFSSIPNYVGDLFAFLFGDVLGISVSDMVALIVLVVALLLLIRALWKELLFATFDPLGAGAAGAGGAHAPEVVVGRDADDPVVRKARDLLPEIRGLIVGVIDGDE